MKRHIVQLSCLAIIALLLGCNDQFSRTLFKSQYPHQRYLSQLGDAGLDQSVLFLQWQQEATNSLLRPMAISVPHQESAYIPRTQPKAMGYRFDARQGERLQVALDLQQVDSAQVFVDLFEESADTTGNHRHLISADTGSTNLAWDVRRDARYILRIQPELLAEVSFRLRVVAEPSIGNPVETAAKQHIGSVFGDPRDGGRRRHEGIDIFAARLTPVVAATAGTVSRVGDNRLGGKVVWLRPSNSNLRFYYAHLDSQLVVAGQSVQAGDTLGLMGTTGNARTTPPHLHFGIYGPGGAIDPLPFVQPGKSSPKRIQSDTTRVGDTLRLTARIDPVMQPHAPVVVEAAHDDGYRVQLPDESRHFLHRKQVAPLTRIRSIQTDRQHALYAQPDTSAAQIAQLPSGQQTDVLAEYEGFLLIEQPIRGWIVK